ncbi:MAG: hypothetical protein ACK44A_17690, partial [Roseateles sp.]
KAAAARVDASIRRDDAAALEAMKKQGLTVVTPSAEDAAYFRQIGETVVRRLYEEGRMDASLLTAIREAKAASGSAD